jgi:predicted nucleotidyltransferase
MRGCIRNLFNAMVKCPIKEIAKFADEAGVPFLVIGGYAVIAHGYVRATEDLDLIVERGRRLVMGKLLVSIGMSVENDSDNFTEYDSPGENDMDVDLMFVSEGVFEKLEGVAMSTIVEGVPVRVVSLLHLIALKCHSAKNSKYLRRLKDVDDLIQLILINHLDLNEPGLRAIILKHGNPEIYESLQKACRGE